MRDAKETEIEIESTIEDEAPQAVRKMNCVGTFGWAAAAEGATARSFMAKKRKTRLAGIS